MRSELEKLRSLATSIGREDLRKVVEKLLENPELSISSAKPLISLEECPAAPRKHHAFRGGLALHTLSVAKLALALARILEEVYGIEVDKDLVLATAILHDLYKLYQYDRDPVEGGYRAREDWYLSHDYALIAQLGYMKAPEDLIRTSSEVHGIAPITTFEGLIVHLADSVDARIGEYVQNIVLSRIKIVENEGCKPFRVFLELVDRYGLPNIVKKALGNPDELRSLAIEVCRSLKGQNIDPSSRL